jgi:hypothetical protein
MTYRLHTHAESHESSVSKSSSALLLISALALVMMISPADAGDIYKWVDEQGNVHYSSEKPVDAPVESVHVNTEKTGNVAGQQALATEQKKIADEAKAIKEKGIPASPPVPSLSAKDIKQRCQQARSDLANIESHGQLRIQDDKGNLSYATDEVKQQRIAAAKNAIREYCH